MQFPNVQLLKGETVIVKTPTVTYDEHNEAVTTWEEETVKNVLVSPDNTDSSSDTASPFGTEVIYKLGFPKTFSASLRNCVVTVRGEDFMVVGDPKPNTFENCPTSWWYSAEVIRKDG